MLNISLLIYQSFVLITDTMFASFTEIYNEGSLLDHLTCNTFPSNLNVFIIFNVFVSII